MFQHILHYWTINIHDINNDKNNNKPTLLISAQEHIYIAIKKRQYCHRWHFHSKMILSLPVFTYEEKNRLCLKLVPIIRRVLKNWNKSTYTWQFSSLIYYTMKNLVHSPSTEPTFTFNKSILIYKMNTIYYYKCKNIHQRDVPQYIDQIQSISCRYLKYNWEVPETIISHQPFPGKWKIQYKY